MNSFYELLKKTVFVLLFKLIASLYLAKRKEKLNTKHINIVMY